MTRERFRLFADSIPFNMQTELTRNRCYRVGRVTYYHSYACGFRGVSCLPKPLPSPSSVGSNSVCLTDFDLLVYVLLRGNNVPRLAQVVVSSGQASSGSALVPLIQPRAGGSGGNIVFASRLVSSSATSSRLVGLFGSRFRSTTVRCIRERFP